MKTYTLEQFKKFATEIEAYENGEQIEIYDSVNRIWVYQEFQNFYPNMEYRIKTKSREEITANWVKENDLKIGDKIKVLKGFEDDVFGISKGRSDSCINKVMVVDRIGSIGICFESNTHGWEFPVECLEKVKEEYVPFTYEDRDLFRGAWVKNKEFNEEYFVTYLNETKIGLDNTFYSYQDLFNRCEFLDGTPFGKLITK